MWLRYSLMIPAGQEKDPPASTEISVPEGIVHRFRMRYPPGPNGTVSSGVFLGGMKMFPQSPSEWFIGDDEWIEGDTHIVTKKGWHWFIHGYSPYAFYEHTVYVDIMVDREEDVSPWRTLEDLIRIIKQLIGL